MARRLTADLRLGHSRSADEPSRSNLLGIGPPLFVLREPRSAGLCSSLFLHLLFRRFRPLLLSALEHRRPVFFENPVMLHQVIERAYIFRQIFFPSRITFRNRFSRISRHFA